MRIFLLALLALPALAQVESVKFHYGDDLRWADPGFDDSGWLDGNAPFDREAHLSETWQWARYKVRIPNRTLDPVIGLVLTTSEVFVEGRRIGVHGQLPPSWRDAPLAYATFPVPPDLATPGRLLNVSLRIWRFPGGDLRRFVPTSMAPPLLLHNAGETALHADLQNATVRGRMWAFAITGLLLLFLFLSGPAQWSQREFQLLVGYLLAHLANAAFFVAGYYLPFGNRNFFFTTLCLAAAYCLQLELLANLTRVPPPWWLRLVQGINLATYLPIAWAVLQLDAPAWLPFIGQGWTRSHWLNAAAAIGLVVRQRASVFSERLLPWGVALFFLGIAALHRSRNAVSIFDVTFNVNILANLLLGAWLVAVHLYRLKKSSEVAARLQGQFAAARDVQEMLLSGNVPATPHYAVDPIYRPAEEVGGDFFRILPASEDSTLVIVGDVSGKGLRAAMLVSVIVGVLLHRRSNEPAEVLSELNGVLTGQLNGGFVTCCAMLLRADGAGTLANAGHPSPYSAGREVDVPAGLPLGVVPGATYEEHEISLGARDYLTLVSDGVIEAANAKGELFGFDRTREVSGNSAQQIAEAAQAWGQNDDITVVTVRRAG
jgi:hypothetical protein